MNSSGVCACEQTCEERACSHSEEGVCVCAYVWEGWKILTQLVLSLLTTLIMLHWASRLCVYVCVSVFKLDCTYQFNFIPPSAHFFPPPGPSSSDGLLRLNSVVCVCVCVREVEKKARGDKVGYQLYICLSVLIPSLPFFLPAPPHFHHLTPA